MSDNTTAPSAERILKEYNITPFTSEHSYDYLYPSTIAAMHQHTRLHLEEMAKEIARYTDAPFVMTIATDYISKIK